MAEKRIGGSTRSGSMSHTSFEQKYGSVVYVPARYINADACDMKNGQ
jgi:hypothetical protein